MRDIQLDHWYFSGDEEMNTTLDATAVSDQTSNYPELAYSGVVRLTSTDHGFKAGDVPGGKEANCVFIQGTTNYDGLRRIIAVAANTLDILAKFVAETPGGTEIARPALQFDDDWLLHGFKLHLASASATSENLVCSVDANKGAAWDVNIYTKDMNTVQDVIRMFDIPIIIAPKDIVYFTWANTNNQLWGLEVITSRVS
jgi:hypothetical protein